MFSFNKNKKIAFLGYGSLASQIHNYIESDLSEEIVIFDNNTPGAFHFDSYTEHILDYNWIISIGYKHLSKKLNIINTITSVLNHDLPKIIHSSSYISNKSHISSGVIIYPMCNIDTNVVIEKGVLLHNSVIVSHDSKIDIGTYISPGVTIAGNVNIGKSCFIGAGSIISNNVNIGDNVVIGAGTVITKNIPNNSNVIGNPMKILNKQLKLI